MSLSLSFSLSEDLTPRRFYYGNCEAKRSVHPCFLQISCATCYPTSASDSRPPVSVSLRLPSTVTPSTSFSSSSSFLPSRQVDARRERALLMQHEKLASLSFITIERERKRKREGGRKILETHVDQTTRFFSLSLLPVNGYYCLLSYCFRVFFSFFLSFLTQYAEKNERTKEHKRNGSKKKRKRERK